MGPWRRGAAGDGWTSVVFGTDRIDVVHARRRPDQRVQVRAWQSFARSGTDLDALKRLRGARHLAGRCTTVLHHGQYQLLQIESPAVPEEELRNALRWRVKDMVDFPIEQAGIDYLPVPTGAGARGGGPQVYVVAASHGVLAPQVRLFQDAGVTLDAIDVPEFAQRNVAALFEDENRALALLAFDGDGGRLTFTYQGELYVARHVDVTPEALAGGDTGAGGIYERVLLDVQRSLDNFDRNYSAVSLSRLLLAPVPGAPGFVDYLKGNLYQAVEPLNLADRLDLAEVPALAEPARQAEALLAIGAALRGEEPAAP